MVNIENVAFTRTEHAKVNMKNEAFTIREHVKVNIQKCNIH